MSPRLVVTVGPASRALVRRMAEAGATELRFNASHRTPEQLGEDLRAARRDAAGVPLVVDLAGAKPRLGDFEDRPLAEGERIVFSAAPAGDEIPLARLDRFPAPREGDCLSIDDDRIRVRVVRASAGRIEAECETGGRLSGRKGIGGLGRMRGEGGLTAEDRASIAAALGIAGVSFALSFVSDGVEAGTVREIAPGRAVVGKIEHRDAADSVAVLSRHFDALWIARGDLGAQIGATAMARWVAQFDPRKLSVPVLMAGEVLHGLVSGPRPSRAEVCHLHDVLRRGYAGIVLSDETAVGADPVRAVSTAATLLADL